MNPIIPTVFTADPAAHVWPNDERIFIYTSHDQPDTNTHDTMASYHVFSSHDLVNWTDHGCALHIDDVAWASTHMWAPDAAYRHGRYYLVYCAYEKGTPDFRTALAVCDRPEGPYVDIGPIEGVPHGQDPALFVDDDNRVYLYWGYGGNGFACELQSDLRAAIPGTLLELTDQLPGFFEGPFVHKYRGKYYLSYAALPDGDWPQAMFYATAEHPMGPYEAQGEYVSRFEGQAGTNHGSIVQYKDRWYAFYHSAWVSHVSECRSSMCDELFYNGDGTIRPILPSIGGVALSEAEPEPCSVTVEIDAATVEKARGKIVELKVARDVSGYTGAGYLTGFETVYNGMTCLVQNGYARKALLRLRYYSPKSETSLAILVNYTRIEDPGYEGEDRHYKTCLCPQADGWAEVDLGIVSLDTGDNWVRIFRGVGGELDGFCLDRIQLLPVHDLSS